MDGIFGHAGGMVLGMAMSAGRLVLYFGQTEIPMGWVSTTL